MSLTIMPEGVPIPVMGNEAHLREAVENLVSNAIKYTHEGGHVDVSLEFDGVDANFKVKDDGIGIQEEHQGRVFEPFYRAKSEETLTIEGTGLGLHMVKQIVERHGGKMILESVYREGSTFGFRIPVVF
jgi:two-component system phosphate regulon sensor histidine kinase PhoR